MLLVRTKSKYDGSEALEFWCWHGLGEHVGRHFGCAKMLELYDACLDTVDHKGELVHKVFGALVISAVVAGDGDVGKTVS